MRREAGDDYRYKLLAHGGGKQPRDMIFGRLKQLSHLNQSNLRVTSRWNVDPFDVSDILGEEVTSEGLVEALLDDLQS